MTLESLLSSAPPGQLDSLVEDLSTLMTVPSELVEKIKENAAVSVEISNHPFAQSLGEELKSHQQEYYSHLDYKFSITGDDEESNFKLTTYAERIDTKNYHAGSWRGDWQIDMTSENSAVLTGSIHIHVYCHEDCNVQLETNKKYDAIQITTTTTGSNNNLAKSIQTKICTLESDVAAELEEMYTGMDDKLKALRRVLPVMRRRLDWNVLSHRMVKNLEEIATAAVL
jgi:hypothetical protein